ncbi:MAG: ribonucleotide reductase N-terminal alpha domain-containing protein, partial [Pseudomonadota bacterium]
MSFSEAAKDIENASTEIAPTPEKPAFQTRPDTRKPALKVVRDIVVDRSRDALLTEFGKTTMEDRYLLPGESFQDMFARVARTYGDDADHAQRIYDYISKLWFMPATPVLSNGGADRGLPISCFLNGVGDSLDDIVGTWN